MPSHLRLSAFANLGAADSAAQAANDWLVIDQNVTLTAATTLNAPGLLFDNAIITLGAFNLTVNGIIVADDYQACFAVTGAGRVTPIKNPELSVYWFGAAGDGSVDDAPAINATITAAIAGYIAMPHRTGATVRLHNGLFKIQSTVNINGSYVNVLGNGWRSSQFWFSTTTGGTAMQVGSVGNTCSENQLKGVSFFSDDITHTKVAIDIYDVSSMVIDDINIYGTGTDTAGGAFNWQGGATTARTGSIGIRTQGRENTTVSNIYIIADQPIYINANPNTLPAANEDMDHWAWTNCYLLPGGVNAGSLNANYAVTVAPGIGMSHVVFEGNQSPVGGLGFFTMNDTRASGGGMLPSRNIAFKNFRTEGRVDSTAYAFDMAFTASCQELRFENGLADGTGQGFKLSGVERLIFDGIIGANATDLVRMTAPNSNAVIEMRGCVWQLGGALTLPGYVTTNVEAFNTASYGGPSTATYVAAPGVNLDFRYSGRSQNGVTTLSWTASLTAAASQLLASNINGQGVTAFMARAVGAGGGVVESGVVYGTGTSSALLSGSANFAAASTAGKLCLYVDGSNNLWLLNNTAQTLKCETIVEARL